MLDTNAPLSDRNLTRLAWRGWFGLARTGASFSDGSGDYALAFSSAQAVYNSLTMASDMTGHQGLTIKALPLDNLRKLTAKR